jgi:hypothetical protein
LTEGPFFLFFGRILYLCELDSSQGLKFIIVPKSWRHHATLHEQSIGLKHRAGHWADVFSFL